MSMVELFVAAQAWAAPAGEHHPSSIHDIWFPLANFLIFAYILKRFAVPVVADYVRSRRQEVLSAMARAAEGKERAQALLADYQRRLERVEDEARSIQVLLTADGERERSKLLAEAETMATKIKEDARFLAAQEVKLARQLIRQEIGEQAAAGARELILRHMSATDQARLVQQFISNIGQVR